ncbi:MAG: FAD:protein FMN transferase [Phycisphaerales bacterium]
MTTASIERLAAWAMGTRFELVLAADDAGGGGRELRAIGEAALAEVADLDARWSLFRPDSVVSLINREAGERAVRVDHDTFAVLMLAERVRVDSGGLFDVAVADAMERWGFRGEDFTTEARRTQSQEQIGLASNSYCVAAPGSPPCSLCLCDESSSVRFIRPGTSIDVGGIAKGYAIDAALRVLREHGVTRALIHGGTSSVGAIGAPPGEDGWRVAIESPGGRTGCGRPVVTLRDSCLAVSSPSGREVEFDGLRFGHIIDPRTGDPAACARTACVIGPSAALCDAWAKPVLIERGRPRGLPTGYAILVDPDGDSRAGHSPGCCVTDPLRSLPEARPTEVR